MCSFNLTIYAAKQFITLILKKYCVNTILKKMQKNHSVLHSMRFVAGIGFEPTIVLQPIVAIPTIPTIPNIPT